MLTYINYQCLCALPYIFLQLAQKITCGFRNFHLPFCCYNLAGMSQRYFCKSSQIFTNFLVRFAASVSVYIIMYNTFSFSISLLTMQSDVSDNGRSCCHSFIDATPTMSRHIILTVINTLRYLT